MSLHPIPVLLFEIIQDLRARNRDRAPLIGVAGAQGSGKSYQCRILTMANQPRFAHFSLDDVYLTRAARADMATRVHPLFATRGPPGTHDLALAANTIEALRRRHAIGVPLPRFDKATDDRVAKNDWPLFNGAPEAILVDGWCLGAAAPVEPVEDEPTAPINDLERLEDADGVWRRAINQHLRAGYRDFFARFDAIVYMRAPSWEIVRTWRGQQEEQALGRKLTGDENASLDRFVMHYERISRSMMAGHHSANWIVQLDEARKVTRIEEM
ncbi:MAG: hypothetical protein R3C31_14105 [Hyphomonadaceae bacterium]